MHEEMVPLCERWTQYSESDWIPLDITRYSLPAEET